MNIINYTISAVILLLPLIFLLFIRSLKEKQVEKLLTSSLPKYVTLAEKKRINHDTILLKMSLPKRNMILGIEVGQHIRL